jgi:transposase
LGDSRGIPESNIPSPGAPPKLDDMHKAFLRRIVDEGPIPAAHGVVRWRASDLIMRLHEEFGLSASDDTIYRALKDLGFLACECPAESLQAGRRSGY